MNCRCCVAGEIGDRLMTKPTDAEGGTIEDLMNALNEQPDVAPLAPELMEGVQLPDPLQPSDFDLEKAMDDIMTRFEETLDYLAH